MKTIQKKIFILIALLVYIASNSKTPVFAQDVNSFLQSKAEWWSTTSQGSLTNQSRFKETKRQKISARPLDFQTDYESSLEVIKSSGSPLVEFLLNGKKISPAERVSSPSVLEAGSIWYMASSGEENRIQKITETSETSYRILPDQSRTTQLLSVTRDGQYIRGVWTDKNKKGPGIYTCIFLNNTCEAKRIKSLTKIKNITELKISQGKVVWLTRTSSGSSITTCTLDDPRTKAGQKYNNICGKEKNYRSPHKIKHLSLMNPQLSWSEQREGIYEIFTSNTDEKTIEASQRTENSEADQLHSSISHQNSKNTLISWEDYSSGESSIKLMSLRQNKAAQILNFKASGQLPHLSQKRSEKQCSETISLRFKTDKELISFERTREEKKFITKMILLPEIREKTEVNIKGQQLSEVSLDWRRGKNKSWTPIQAEKSENPNQKKWIITEALDKVQLRIKLGDTKDICIRSLKTTPLGRKAIVTLRSEELQTLNIDIKEEPQISGILTNNRISIPTTKISSELNQSLQDLAKPKKSGVRITNIFERSSISKLNLVTGSGRDLLKPIWLFMINDQKESITLGTQALKADRTFRIPIPELPEAFKGEVTIVASHIPDIRLANSFPKQTHAVTLYLFTESDILKKKPTIDLAIELKSLHFFQGNKELKQFKQDHITIAVDKKGEDLRIEAIGKIFGEHIEKIDLISEFKEHQTLMKESVESSGRFHMEKKNISARTQEGTQELILYAVNDDKQQSSSQVITFNIIDSSHEPNWTGLLWKNIINNNSIIIYIGLLLLFMLFAYSPSLQEFSKTRKTAKVFLSIQVLVLFVFSTQIIITKGFEQGLINAPWMSSSEHFWRLPKHPSITLTKLDENLSVVPNLAKSWSNIEPRIWEFSIRKDKEGAISSSRTILQSIKQLILENHPAQQYLSSLEQVILMTDERLQFITKRPDPLLPQKLSQVPLLLSKEISKKNHELSKYKLIEDYSNSRRWKINPSYRDKSFTDLSYYYKNQIALPNEEAMLKSIKKGSINKYNSALPNSWSELIKGGYEVQPSISTESLILLTNRKSYYLNNKDFVHFLSKTLKTSKLLKGEHERLLNQFVPPGVLGFDPKLIQKKSELTFDNFQDSFKTDQITLTLNFPTRERETARKIESLLQEQGILIIPKEYPSTEFEQLLLKDLPDLVLVPLQFELGDAGSFYDSLIDSKSPFNNSYSNEEVDKLVNQARYELDNFKRSQILKRIMNIITQEDPAGIPLLYRTQVNAVKKESNLSWKQKIIKWILFGKF